MRPVFFFYFLTLVVLMANAAPEATVRPAPFSTRENTVSSPSQNESDLTQATRAPEARLTPRRQKISDGATNFGFGSSSGQFDKEKETLSLLTYHLQRTQYNLDETAQEYGFSLVSNGFFSMDWGFKKFCCFTSDLVRWNPYYKVGVTGFFDPKDQLGNFIDYRRYFLQVSAGFDNLFLSRQAFKLDVGARAGHSGSQLFAEIFYSIPD